MACFCFLVDQRRTVRSSKPTAGICGRCGGAASVAEMETATRFCCIALHRSSRKAVVCGVCGAVLKRYNGAFLKAYRRSKKAS